MFSLSRGLNRIYHLQSTAQLSILCRGKSISPDELFAYTNGHFLVDEQHQLARRYVKFDLDALCNVATAVGVDPSPVLSVEKMEGGFSKALLMNKENGTEVVAKLPCRIAGPAELTTASEVGVLKYLHRNTNIPVPRVLQWSSNKASSVGAEYIIMEKAAGVPLFRRWGVMTEPQKLQLVQNLTKLEAQLSAIRFPAYGGLYLRDYLQNSDYRCLLLDDNVDPSQSFSVGPSPDRSFDTQCAEQPTPSNKPTDRGPWTTLSGLGIAIAERELSRISGIPPNKSAMFYRGTLEEQSQLLNFTIRLMPMLDSHPLLGQSAQPTLWHTDLHMGNIYVAPEDSTRIVSIIDFQSLAVMPAFLQSRWPEFLKPPDNYTQGFAHPELPDGYDNMDDESKLLARREWSQAKLAKAYEVSTYLENRPAHIARNIPRVIQELFIRSGEVSEMGVIPLRACLIEIFQNWADLGFTGSCPFSFTEEDIETHERQFVEYQAWHEVQHLAQECLDTDTEGWISPELDIEEKRRQNRELLAMFIERMADEKSPEARRMWPFLDDG
ncbi:phosphotransferase enzyme family protein [Aspergillus niger]|nr:phosphotransferase enzyme family protein [Aspergillus niger]